MGQIAVRSLAAALDRTLLLRQATSIAALALEDMESLAGSRIKNAGDELDPLTASGAKRRGWLRFHGYT